jgi:hypothetical protein
MNAETFKAALLENDKKDYGLCPPPLDAQKGLNILIEHFLGSDWYVVMPLCTEQVNAEAVYEILRRHGEKRSIWKFFQQHTTNALCSLRKLRSATS